MNKVIAIVCADLHLSHTPPAARSVEPDWYAAQGRYLDELVELVEQHGADIYIAGDLFHWWKSPPELINWAIEKLSPAFVFAIPGQHDLPNHNLEEIRKSAFQTLLSVEVVDGDFTLRVPGPLTVDPFPWGCEIKPREVDKHDLADQFIHMALIHQYTWIQGHSYQGAAEESRVGYLAKSLKGYDIAVFGDNHKPFEHHVGNCVVFNCGCLIPRASDERDIRPSVGLVRSDGTITRHYLNTHVNDLWAPVAEGDVEYEESTELTEFLQKLETLEASTISFHTAIMQLLDEKKKMIRPGVKAAILEALGEND